MLIIAVGAGGPSAGADPVTDFYKGKNVTLQVGSGAGGGYDIVGRVVARHIGQYIPGQPNIVVQNVPGGGSLNLANQFANITPRNGSVFGIMNDGMPTTPLLNPKAAHFDPRKFNFIGSPSEETQVLVVWHTSPVKTLDDVFKKELVVGATAPGGAPYDYPLVTNVVLGTKYKVVKGYPGNSETMLALQRGEIQGDAGLGWESAKADQMEAMKRGDLLVVAQYGMQKYHELENVPLFPLGKTKEDREILELLYARQLYGRMFVAPPDVPADRLAALRSAFEKTMKDRDFVAEMGKLSIEVDPVSWQTLRDLTDRIYKTPSAVLARMQAALQSSVETKK
jgi:tripartite-type tricarboxylate transporter receptor subunit TctC